MANTHLNHLTKQMVCIRLITIGPKKLSRTVADIVQDRPTEAGSLVKKVHNMCGLAY